MKPDFKINNLVADLAELVCVILIFLSFQQYIGISSGMIFKVFRLILSCLIWIYILFKTVIDEKELMIIILFGAYTIIFSLIGNGSYQVALFYLPISIFLLKTEKVNRILWYALSLIIFAITFNAWMHSPNKYILFSTMSRNYVSVFALFSLGLLNLVFEKDDKELPILFAIINFAVCISAIGRGGILEGAIVLILFGAKWIFNKGEKRSKKRVMKILAVTVALIIMSIIVCANLEYIKMTYFGRFFGAETSATSSSLYRMDILSNYLDACKNSFRVLFFGENAADFFSVNANLHNSYFQLHSQFGLAGILFIIIGSINSIRFLYKNKLWSSAIIFIGILIRAATDWCFPGFPMEILVLYYIFRPYINNKTRYANAEKFIKKE